jgi:hypothetical protein
MIGFYTFGGLLVAGFAALIVVKIKWSGQTPCKWPLMAASNNALNSYRGLVEGPGLGHYFGKGAGGKPPCSPGTRLGRPTA